MKARFRFVAIVVLLTVPLVLLLHGLTGGALLAQVQQAIWWTGLVLGSLPQLPIWVLFVGLAFAFAVLTLLTFIQPSPEEPAPEAARAGRIETLARRIERARSEDYTRWDVGRQVGQLVLQLLAHQRQATLREIRQQMRAGQLDVPPEIQACLLAGLSLNYGLSGGLALRLRRLFSARAGTAANGETVERLVEFVEGQLEVLHER